MVVIESYLSRLIDRLQNQFGTRLLYVGLQGGYLRGEATDTSDIDFVVYGCEDILKLEDALEEILTLRKIDIFDYENIHNEFLMEDIKKYGKQIY